MAVKKVKKKDEATKATLETSNIDELAEEEEDTEVMVDTEKDINTGDTEVEELEIDQEGVQKKVSISVNNDISCYIGNTYYRLKRGEEVEVPVNVKSILLNAGYLMPL